MTRPRNAARQLREELKEEVRRLEVLARGHHDVTQAELARACGVEPTRVSRWECRDHRESPTLADVALWPTEVALPLLRWLADRHGMVIGEAPDADEVDDDLAHAARVVRECSELMARLTTAVADGHLTPEECDELEQDCLDVMGIAQTTLYRVRAAREARGEPVRRRAAE